jgi:hypothetical protein
MADRGFLRFDTAPMRGGPAKPWPKSWAKFILPFIPVSHIRATGFNQSIAKLSSGDETLAFAMYAGQFNFAGETINCTAPELFSKSRGSSAWRRHLNDLSWLTHFAASKRNLHAHYALRLLGRWAKADHAPRDVQNLCHIILTLTLDGQALARQCEPQLQIEFLDIITLQTKRLLRKTPHNPEALVLKAIALLCASTAFHGFESLRKSASEILTEQIEKIILPDGGHVSRDPNKLVELLALLVPLKAAMKKDRQIFPINTLERMLPMLTMLQHGDGGLAAFKGAPQNCNIIKSILHHDDVKAQPLAIAPHSGYARLTQGASCLLADTKQNFEVEFSDGEHRLFRNHVLCSGQAAPAQLRQSSQGSLLQMTQNNGLERTCFLSSDGMDLRFEDIHSGALELVFEIDKAIKISALRDNAGLLLVTPNRDAWKLSLRGGEIHTEQNGAIIKITSTDSRRVNWALKKQTKSPKQFNRQINREPDLLSP